MVHKFHNRRIRMFLCKNLMLRCTANVYFFLSPFIRNWLEVVGLHVRDHKSLFIHELVLNFVLMCLVRVLYLFVWCLISVEMQSYQNKKQKEKEATRSSNIIEKNSDEHRSPKCIVMPRVILGPIPKNRWIREDSVKLGAFRQTILWFVYHCDVTSRIYATGVPWFVGQ